MLWTTFTNFQTFSAMRTVAKSNTSAWLSGKAARQARGWDVGAGGWLAARTQCRGRAGVLELRAPPLLALQPSAQQSLLLALPRHVLRMLVCACFAHVLRCASGGPAHPRRRSIGRHLRHEHPRGGRACLLALQLPRAAPRLPPLTPPLVPSFGAPRRRPFQCVARDARGLI